MLEDGEPQNVDHFMLGDSVSVPRTIVLIIDYSGSQFPYLRKSIDAAKLMVDKLPARDRMAIVTDDVEVLVDFTDNKNRLKQKLNEHMYRTYRTVLPQTPQEIPSSYQSDSPCLKNSTQWLRKSKRLIPGINNSNKLQA